MGMLRASQSDFLGAHHFTIQCPGGTISNDNPERELRMARADGSTREIRKKELEAMEPGNLWEYRSWIEAIHDGTPLIVDAWDGRQAVAMACAAMESAQTGKAVPVR